MSQFQKFEMRSVPRSSIALADYNPRVITDHAKKELRKKMRTVGLLAPVIWNETTGKLLSGHQRLSQLDVLEKYQPGGDYALDVAVVRLDEKTEKEMNVFLNNPSAQGEFDIDMLKEMLDFGDIDLNEMGFEDADINIMFEDIDIIGNIKDGMAPSEATGQLEDIKNSRKKATDKLKKDNEADFYFVVVCRDEREKKALLRAFSTERDDQQFVRSTAIIAAMADPAMLEQP